MFVKYLGILIDSSLGWKFHIDSICKKIKKSIGILSKLRYFVSLKILVNLYFALIYPFLTYGLIVGVILIQLHCNLFSFCKKRLCGL